MSWFLLAGLLFSIFWIYKTWNYTWTDEEGKSIIRKIFDCIWKPILSLLAFMFISLAVLSITGGFYETHRVKDGYTSLHAIGDRFASEGSLFLGTGSVEGVSYYYYYYKKGKGYKQSRIRAGRALIIEDNSEPPRIQHYKYEFIDKEDEKWGIPSQKGSRNVEIFVPLGSVKSEKNFDLN